MIRTKLNQTSESIRQFTNDLLNSLDNAVSEKEKISKEISDLIDKKVELDNYIKDKNKELSDRVELVTKKESEIKELVAQIDIEILRKKEELETKGKEIENLYIKIESLVKQIELLETKVKEVSSVEKLKDDLNGEIKELNKVKQDLVSDISNLESEYAEKQSLFNKEIKSVKEKVESDIKNIESENKRLLAWNNQLDAKEQELKRKEADVVVLKNRYKKMFGDKELTVN